MANHKSAKKATRQIAKRTARNKSRLSRIRTFVKKLETTIVSGDKKKALELFKEVQSELMCSVTKGVLKKNTASRKISRLAARVKKVA